MFFTTTKCCNNEICKKCRELGNDDFCYKCGNDKFRPILNQHPIQGFNNLNNQSFGQQATNPRLYQLNNQEFNNLNNQATNPRLYQLDNQSFGQFTLKK